MKKRGYLVVALMLCIVMTGCSKKTPSLVETKLSDNTILVFEDGTVECAVIEEFKKDYYSEEGLRSFVEKNIGNYTKMNGEDTITLEQLTVENQSAKMILTYKTAMDYTAFNENEIVVLSQEEALKDERIPVKMKDDDGDEILKKDALKDEDAKAVIINEPGYNVIVDGKVKSYFNGSMINSKTVQTEKKDPTIIIFE